MSLSAILNTVGQCGDSYSSLAWDIYEAANFATYFTESPAAESTPHLYISALAIWQQDSEDTRLFQNWKNQFTGIPAFKYTEGSIMSLAKGSITDVAFSSDGTQIVTGLDDGSVWVWDVSTGTEVKKLKLKGHTGLVSSVVFSSDGMKIASGSYDNSVQVWDALTGVRLKKLKGHTGFVFSVAFSRDGMKIVSGSYDNSVRVWDVLTGMELKELRGHTELVNSVTFSNNGKQIVSSSNDSSVRVWDVLTGVELKKLNGHTECVNSVAFSSDGTQIVSGSDDSSVRVWDVSTGVELKELKGHTECVNSVAFSSDGTQIVSGSDDNSVRVWDVSTGVELKKLKGHSDCVSSVAFSSDGTQIVSGPNDNSLRVWDVSKIGCEDFVWNLADDNWIISSHGQDHLMWVPQEANLLQGFNIPISHSGFSTVDFSQSMIGVDWIHCYTPTSHPHLSDKSTTQSEIPFNDSPIQVSSTSVQQIFKSPHHGKQPIKELGTPSALALVEDLLPNKLTGVPWSQLCHCITAETALVHVLNFNTQLLAAFKNVGFGGEYRIQVGFNPLALHEGMLVEEISIFLDKDLQVSEDNACTTFASVFVPFPGVVYTPRQVYSIPVDPPTRGVLCTIQGPVGRTQATAANSGTTGSGEASGSIRANSTHSGHAANNKTMTNEKHQARRGRRSGGPDDSGSESDDSPRDNLPTDKGKGKGRGDQLGVRLLDIGFSSTLSITIEGLEGKNELKTASNVRIIVSLKNLVFMLQVDGMLCRSMKTIQEMIIHLT